MIKLVDLTKKSIKIINKDGSSSSKEKERLSILYSSNRGLEIWNISG